MPYLVRTWDTGETFCISDHTLLPQADETTGYDSLGLMKRSNESVAEVLTVDNLLECFGVEFYPRLVFQARSVLRNWAIWSLPPPCAEIDAAACGWSDKLDAGYLYPELLVQPAANDKGESIGYGLFATTSIPQGEYIGEYTGIVRASGVVSGFDSYGCIYPNCQEAMHISATEHGNLLRFINHAQAHNVAFKTASHENLMHIVCVTTKPIEPGEELLVNYGESYWQGYKAANQAASAAEELESCPERSSLVL